MFELYVIFKKTQCRECRSKTAPLGYWLPAVGLEYGYKLRESRKADVNVTKPKDQNFMLVLVMYELPWNVG